jgi:hypothetical protein
MAKIRLARSYTAMPAKSTEVLAIAREVAAVIKRVADVDVTIFATMGSQVNEFVSVTNYSSFAEFEEKGNKILGNPEYQAVIRKYEGLLVPGSIHDRLLREV